MHATNRFLGVVLLGCLFLLALGCARQQVLTPPEAPAPSPEAGRDNFQYQKSPFEVKLGESEDRETYDLVRVAYPSYFHDNPDEQETVAWYYRQKQPGPKPGILVIPILGGDYTPSKLFASYYARRGFQVLRFERKAVLFNQELGLEHTRRTMVSAVIDLRRGLDWWETLPEVAADKIGVSGISMGGFIGSMLVAVDDRIAAAALMLNGGDIPQLLVMSEEQEVVEIREGLQKKHQWDNQTMYEEGTRVLGAIDPITLAPLIDPKKIMLISARFDKVVPYDLSTRWWQAAHRPKRVVVPTGHYSAIVFLHYFRWRCSKFFRGQFGLSEDWPEE